MNKLWTESAWEDYWQQQDKKTLKRIHLLLKDIERIPNTGIGKPEELKYEFQGFWSRRIDDVNRLVYRVRGNAIEILSCRTHYKKS